MALAAWTADSAAATHQALPGAAALTVASVTAGAVADAAKRAKSSRNTSPQEDPK